MNRIPLIYRRFRPISILILVELFLLGIQFLLGMWMNEFAVYPVSGFYVMKAMITVPGLMAHIMLGILIGIISASILFMSIASRKWSPVILSAISSVSILAAGISGLEFMFGDFTNNSFSFSMSVFFVVSVISYSYMIFALDGRR